MSCYLGMTAALYVRAATGETPTTLVGDLLDDVGDVTMNTSSGLADVTSRANSGWRSQCATLRDLSVDITYKYKGVDTQLTALRTAYFTSALVDASILTAKAGAYEGLVGRFAVTSFGLGQPLEEGQEFTISLTLNDFGAWITGTHSG